MTETLTDKIDAVIKDMSIGRLGWKNGGNELNKVIQELREAIRHEYFEYSEVSRMNVEFNQFYTNVLSLIGEKK